MRCLAVRGGARSRASSLSRHLPGRRRDDQHVHRPLRGHAQARPARDRERLRAISSRVRSRAACDCEPRAIASCVRSSDRTHAPWSMVRPSDHTHALVLLLSAHSCPQARLHSSVVALPALACTRDVVEHDCGVNSLIECTQSLNSSTSPKISHFYYWSFLLLHNKRVLHTLT